MTNDTESDGPGGGSCLRVGVGCGALLLMGAVFLVAMGRPLGNRIMGPSPSLMANILEKVADDQETFRAGDQEHDGVQDYGTLDELITADLLLPAYGGGEVMGYAFEIQVSPTAPTERWMAIANAISWSQATPAPAFVINHQRVLHTVPGVATLNPECELPADASPFEPR